MLPHPDWLDELAPAPGPPWHAMGTRTLDSAWLVIDEERSVQLAAKRVLLDTAHAVVSASRRGAMVEEACEEAAALVSTSCGPGLDGRDGDAGRPPLEAAALRVQEDLCILLRHHDHWRLEAGVVCFPSMWNIGDKLGLSLADVHGPVPAYADELAVRVDRFLDRMRADRPVWRRNWLIHDSPELHQPAPPEPNPSSGADPESMWLRSERQTLRRLPLTGAVLFTIRTQQAPLAVLAARPDVAAGITSAVRSWSDDLIRYRGAKGWREPVLQWLDRVSG